MQIIPVTDKTTATEFIQVSVVLHKGDPNWIRPLDKDINEVFDKEKNKAFRFGEVIRWVLKDDAGKLIVRIAAFTTSGLCIVSVSHQRSPSRFASAIVVAAST